MHDYTKLRVWSDSAELALRIHAATQSFPKSERFELTSQIRRAAVSIPSNIAEGASRKSGRAFAQFLRIALGSAYELDTQLYLACGFGYLGQAVTDELRTELLTIRSGVAKLISTYDP